MSRHVLPHAPSPITTSLRETLFAAMHACKIEMRNVHPRHGVSMIIGPKGARSTHGAWPLTPALARGGGATLEKTLYSSFGSTRRAFSTFSVCAAACEPAVRCQSVDARPLSHPLHLVEETVETVISHRLCALLNVCMLAVACSHGAPCHAPNHGLII